VPPSVENASGVWIWSLVVILSSSPAAPARRDQMFHERAARDEA
jgi:hypothetical protein